MTDDEAAQCQIYLITPPRLPDINIFLKQLETALSAAPIACLQIRLKDIENSAIIQAAIGQTDMDYFSSRELLGTDAIIGVTCHNSRDLAFKAAHAGADYVAFGAFFETPTKTPKYQAELEILEWWQEAVEVPCVAIGGINPSNASTIIGAGADFIAVSSGVWDHPHGPAEAVKSLHMLCQR